MDFMEVLRKRRSIRKYKTDPVPDEILEQILEAARARSMSDGILSFEHIILAAINFGLGSCWKGTYLGHLEEHEKEIKNVLGVPENIALVAYTPIGYADEAPEMRDKKSLNEIIHYERW